MVLNSYSVVAGPANGVTRFASLHDALTKPNLKAGDIIQIEPGSSPGHILNTDLPDIENLTI